MMRARALFWVCACAQVFIQGVAMTPTALITGLAEHAKSNGLKGISECRVGR